MTIDTSISAASKEKKDFPTYSCGAETSVTCGKTNIILRCGAWYVFWTVIVLALYWPVLPALPYRDHPYFMLNRQLAGNDWQWFWSVLSYNRTNILMPGDYFLFRPVHMMVIALQDIFLRHNLVAQGVVNCLQLAFTATVFWSLVKRFVGTFAALALTFLWVSLPIGASIVTWQHITPYMLCPAFFMVALRVLDGDDLELSSRTKEVIAALCVFIATLTNEIGVATALSVSLFAMIFGGRDVGRRRQLLMVFLLPVVIALTLNLTDYLLIHPSPLPTRSLNELSSLSLVVLFVKFTGAIGTALFASPALNLKQALDGYTIWAFNNESSWLLISMAVPVSALLLASCITAIRELRQNRISRRTLFLIFLLSFFLATFAACVFRMYSRTPDYMIWGTYYYSLFSLPLSGLAIVLLDRSKKTAYIIVILFVLMSIMHVITSRNHFTKTVSHRKIQNIVTEGRKILSENPGLCFSGIMPFSISYGPLFHDVSCTNRPGAVPLYILPDEQGADTLSSVQYYSDNSKMIPASFPPARQLPANEGWVTALEIPYGHDVQFTANKAGYLSIGFSNQAGMVQSIAIKRNTIRKSVQGSPWVTPLIVESALDNDAAANMITYKLGFTKKGIMVFADGRWIGDFPVFSTETASINMVLRTTDKKPAKIANLLISAEPSLGNMQVTTRYLLTKQ